MRTHRQRGILLLVLGILLFTTGMVIRSHLLAFAGTFVFAISLRYRKKPSLGWYVAFLGLLVLMVALGPPSSPLVAAVPLMLSYVLDYIDERTQRRASQPTSTLAQESGPAQPSRNEPAGSAAEPNDSRPTTTPPSSD